MFLARPRCPSSDLNMLAKAAAQLWMDKECGPKWMSDRRGHGAGIWGRAGSDFAHCVLSRGVALAGVGSRPLALSTPGVVLVVSGVMAWVLPSRRIARTEAHELSVTVRDFWRRLLARCGHQKGDVSIAPQKASCANMVGSATARSASVRQGAGADGQRPWATGPWA